MAAIKGKGTKFEERGFEMLKMLGIKFRRHPLGIVGKPDAANKSRKIAVFFDSDFWHGFDWKNRRSKIKSNKIFWIKKIERNIARDKEVNHILRRAGWTVIRIREHDMKSSNLEKTMKRIRKKLDKTNP